MRPERAVFIKPTVVGAHSLGLAIHSRLPEQLQSRRPMRAKCLRRRTAADLLPCVCRTFSTGRNAHIHYHHRYGCPGRRAAPHTGVWSAVPPRGAQAPSVPVTRWQNHLRTQFSEHILVFKRQKTELTIKSGIFLIAFPCNLISKTEP